MLAVVDIQIHGDLPGRQAARSLQSLTIIEEEINGFYKQLAFRRNFSAYLFLLFVGLSIIIFLLSKSYEEKLNNSQSENNGTLDKTDAP